MQIIIRIPTEAYAYAEVHYDSLGEYEKGYPEFVKVFTKVRKQIREKKDEVPFESENPNRVKMLKNEIARLCVGCGKPEENCSC